MPIDYESISFLLRGKRRKKVLECLKEETKTPKQVAKECKISISNISIALKELREKGLIELKTPEAHTYKFFIITEKGKEILKEIGKM